MAVKKENVMVSDVGKDLDPETMQKAFVLACRFLADYLGCPPECEKDPLKCKNQRQWKCWQKYLKAQAETEAVCRVCGCTQNNACEGGCYWVEPDLCSRCKH